MKYCIVIFSYVITLGAIAQVQNVKQEVKTIIQQRSISLNGGTRAAMGGKSRTTIKIDLPPNTKSWYYSFSTTPGESGTERLNLAMQLSSLAIGPSGITKVGVKSIQVPSGSGSIDVYVLDQYNSDLFLRKIDNDGGTFYYKREGSVFNTKQGVIEIDDFNTGTFYLGLKNPSSLDGINIFIEVVALTESIEDYTESQIEAIAIGNLAWKAFERGDYDKCMELSNKALMLDNSMAYIYFNVALTHLIKGESRDAISKYAKAIAINRKCNSPRKTLGGAIQDLHVYMSKFPSKSEAEDVLFLLNEEIKNYR